MMTINLVFYPTHINVNNLLNCRNKLIGSTAFEEKILLCNFLCKKYVTWWNRIIKIHRHDLLYHNTHLSGIDILNVDPRSVNKNDAVILTQQQYDMYLISNKIFIRKIARSNHKSSFDDDLCLISQLRLNFIIYCQIHKIASLDKINSLTHNILEKCYDES